MNRSAVGFLGLTGCLLLVCARAADVPKLKAGLWEMRVSSSAGGTNSALAPTVCVGTMPDAQRAAEEENIRVRCSRYDVKVVGSDWVVDAVCTARGTTLTKHMVTSLSGDRFHEENSAPQGTMTSDGKWVRPCKPGQAPSVFK
ncbi:MAG: hypothetical protein M3O01_15920 [Pseudomonadota bacterium]|nr:hypothetical protein [Pseudomonadota bacterium]